MAPFVLYNVQNFWTGGQLGTMPQDHNQLLKGANYCEQVGQGEGRAFSALISLEGQNGFVFGVAQSLGSKESFEVFSGIIHSHLERLAGTIEAGTNLTHRFEQLLQAVNEDVARGVEEGLFSLPIHDSSGVIGVASNDLVVVSGFGNLLAQFMHRSEKEQFDIYDLSRGMRVEEEAPSWQKLFLTVLDGEMRAGDVLYVGSKVSRHDLSASTLNEIITTLPPNSAVSKIRQYLPLETVFAAVVIKNDVREEPALKSENTAQASIETLERTTKGADRYLSEQKPEIKSMAIKLWLLLFPKRGAHDRRKLVKKLGRFTGRMIVIFLTIAVQILWGLTMEILAFVKKIAKNPQRVLDDTKRVRDQLDRGVRLGISRFNTLPKTSKYVLLVLLTIGLVLVGGLVIINRQQAAASERQAYELAVVAAEKKIENAEASLIYGDENQARTLLNDAWQMVSTLASNNSERQATVEALQARIQSKRDALRRVTNVEIKQVADASGLTDESLQAIVALNDKWFGVTSSANVYAVDPLNETITKVEITKGEVGAPTATTAGEAALYWLDSGLSRYTPENREVSALSVSRQGVDLQYYGGKMYILSPNSGQVYKHGSTATGFDGGSAWIISGITNLTDARAITIDGYVWILKADGVILRYGSGKETDWKADLVEPALLNATDMWTDETTKYLYVLDATANRIVVFNKDTGELVVQYENAAFSDLKSLIVDEADKTISVLAGSKVYQFATQ